MSSNDNPACGDECQEALTELQRYLDGELPESQFERIQQHLSDCYPCTDRASFEEQLRVIVRRGCVENAPPTLVDSIRDRLNAGNLSAGGWTSR